LESIEHEKIPTQEHGAVAPNDVRIKAKSDTLERK
jgi:hypothetical protein